MHKHHIIKQQMFNKGHLLEDYHDYKDSHLNTLKLDSDLHLNVLHSESKKSAIIREQCYDRAIFELHLLKLDTIDVESFNILKKVYIWSILENWDKSKKDVDLLFKYCEILKKYSEVKK